MISEIDLYRRLHSVLRITPEEELELSVLHSVDFEILAVYPDDENPLIEVGSRKFSLIGKVPTDGVPEDSENFLRYMCIRHKNESYTFLLIEELLSKVEDLEKNLR